MKLGLPIVAALVAIGCGGGNGGNGGNGGGSTSGGGGGNGGGTGTDSVDLTIAKNGSNGRYTSLKATNGSTKIVQITDNNPAGAGSLGLVVNVPEGGTGRTQGLTLQFAHGAALAAGTTFTPADAGEITYSELFVNPSNPQEFSTKNWRFDAGTVEVTEVTATRITMRFKDVDLVPVDAETGAPRLTGTASGAFATD